MKIGSYPHPQEACVELELALLFLSPGGAQQIVTRTIVSETLTGNLSAVIRSHIIRAGSWRIV